MSAILTVTVDQARWRTGSSGPQSTGEGQTRLLNKEGFLCCIGFACLASGLAEEDIKGRGCPSNIPRQAHIPLLTRRRPLPLVDPDDTLFSNTLFVQDAICINDDALMTLEEKKAQLEALGKEHGVKWIWQ